MKRIPNTELSYTVHSTWSGYFAQIYDRHGESVWVGAIHVFEHDAEIEAKQSLDLIMQNVRTMPECQPERN